MTISSHLRAAGAGPTGTWQGASSRTRLGVALVIGIAAAGAVGAAGAWVYAPLAGWDVAALSYTGWLWLSVIAVMTAAQTADHATCEDPSRATTGAVIVVAAVASLAAVGFILVQATSAKGSSQDLLASVGVLSVALSWFTVHTVFTLRYARLYYLGPDGGVNFNQDAPPRYLDFAYLAFTIGMTFQVSDTDLQTGSIRATALRHALLSYLFGAVILATTINLISGLGSGSGGH